MNLVLGKIQPILPIGRREGTPVWPPMLLLPEEVGNYEEDPSVAPKRIPHPAAELACSVPPPGVARDSPDNR